jgi:hypothetical protein
MVYRSRAKLVVAAKAPNAKPFLLGITIDSREWADVEPS